MGEYHVSLPPCVMFLKFLSNFLIFSVFPVLGKYDRYDPSWASLDTRPAPAWYDQAKFGVFMHWGPYSVPGVVSEWFWFYWRRNDPNKRTDVEVNNYMKANYPPDFTYQQFGSDFSAQFFNASEWAEIVAASGAKYFVFTTKHHDGFANWPSSRNFGWNARDTGPKRDIVGELESAFKANGKVKFGLYHSMFEWFNPMYDNDEANNFTTRDYVLSKMMPELTELVMKYKPEILWSDGEAGATVDYWGSLEFLAWLYSYSPVKDTVVTNDRWGRGTQCKHGDFFTCADRYNPGVLQTHKWENAMTVDRKSWGHRRNMVLSDVMSMEELIENLASTVSCGGNLLMNIGPNRDGIIEPVFEERLRGMGDWLGVNGASIYSTKPWTCQNDTVTRGVWYTSKYHKVFAIVLQWAPKIELGCVKPTQGMVISLLGVDGTLKWWESRDKKHISVQMPPRRLVKNDWAWVVQIQNAQTP